MNIFFDMDYTLVAYDGSIRPMTKAILSRLGDDGHDLYIWSGVGVRVDEVRGLGLAGLVKGVYQKPVEQFEEGISQFGIPVRPGIVVDDHEEIVRHFGGVVVRPYFWPDPDDRELERVYVTIDELAKDGSA